MFMLCIKFDECELRDSNPRRRKSADLQSALVDHLSKLAKADEGI
jgi:hypothetical protein